MKRGFKCAKNMVFVVDLQDLIYVLVIDLIVGEFGIICGWVVCFLAGSTFH